MPRNMLGTDSLTEKLTNVLFSQIKSVLPEIIIETGVKIKEAENRLKLLGPSMPTKMEEKFQLLHRLITDFTDA